MPLANTPHGATPVPPRATAGRERHGDAALAAFLDMLAHVTVEAPIFHSFPGALRADLLAPIWTWMARDIAGSVAARLGDAIASGAEPPAAFGAMLPEILDALKANAEAERLDADRQRRNTIQMGGDGARAMLPRVIMAMRRRPLLEQAAKFGTAVGTLADEAAIGTALQTISIANPVTRALWMQVMVDHIGNPSRMMAAVSALSGGAEEKTVLAAGYGPLVDAILSHAQSQIGLVASRPALFGDIDGACKAIDRFHRLVRALNYTLEIDRRSPWGRIIADLTGRMSERLERPLREVNANITQALRRPRDNDRIDPDKILEGFNGLYLLMAVRASRDSLAVNALLDQAWTDTGRTLELLIARALDAYRANPDDGVARERFDAGIKMAEIRFNAEYADILKRARETAARRSAVS
ncbi:hypothetical protein [Pelagibacterium lacus]|uniref:Uncharacterized protein n=1 Tax=Pelagibacterium lacus TaxID=2282655 RepID=A0A369W6Y7_9HYPH|nr:hypothetical protein [Pelagibacterium lacus]RDE10456.1 hypothetical protein DVH29_00440 [Pelagibacterium lacus]